MRGAAKVIFTVLFLAVASTAASASCGGAGAYTSYLGDSLTSASREFVFEFCEDYSVRSDNTLSGTDNVMYVWDRPLKAHVTVHAPSGQPLSSEIGELAAGVPMRLTVTVPLSQIPGGSGYYALARILTFRGSSDVQATASTSPFGYLNFPATPPPQATQTLPGQIGALVCESQVPEGRYYIKENMIFFCASSGGVTYGQFVMTCSAGQIPKLDDYGFSPRCEDTGVSRGALPAPGFEAVFAILGLLFVAFLIRRKDAR